MTRRVFSVAVILCSMGASIVSSASPALAFVEGDSNNFFGTGAGADPANTGFGNSFFGGDAGNANTTGSSNAFFGRSAGDANTTGRFNSFFGNAAGISNTTGFNNAFFGQGAGRSNTTGIDNAVFGTNAGDSNTTGSDNSFFGDSAGERNTTGPDNSFFGAAAGFFNTEGFSNAFFGRFAGQFNTTGPDNAFFGRDAGRSNTTACCNSFFGRNAGSKNTTGSHNSFFGRDAGLSNTSEIANTFLGAGSSGVSGINNAAAVGNQAQVSQSDSLVLGSTAGFNGATVSVKVGIGTPTPADPLHVRRGNGTAKVLVQEASGTTLGRELFELVNNGAARFRVRNTSNNATWDFQSSSGGGSFVIDRVGGPASLDFEVQPDGDLVVRGSVTGTSFISSSDRNLKTDITPAKASKLMSLLRQLDLSTWRFKDEPEGTINLGPMAQDFHRLFGMGTETTVQIRDLAAVALVAAQSLDEQNADQQKEIDELKRAVADLSARA